ncbi:hypothetical protein U3516DRAFT_761724 [Neocallimastix sp. 'constans']
MGKLSSIKFLIIPKMFLKNNYYNHESPKYIFEEDRLREQQKEFKLLENTKKKKKKDDDDMLDDSLKYIRCLQLCRCDEGATIFNIKYEIVDVHDYIINYQTKLNMVILQTLSLSGQVNINSSLNSLNIYSLSISMSIRDNIHHLCESLEKYYDTISIFPCL